jgi:hypothetical protein
MKKFFVLLIAAAVASGASAGVKLGNTAAKQVATKEMKADAVAQHSKMIKKGDKTAIEAIALKAFDKNVRPTTNHALKDEGTLVWDFEDEAQVADFTMIDADEDGYCWEYTNSENIKAHSGTGVMASASYDNPTYTALTPDNWLISPMVTLTGKLGFYYCGQDPNYAAEVFAVYVWLDGAEEPTKISEDITATGTMQAFEYDLSEFEGMVGNICIRHYNVTDMFRLNIDDLTVGDFQAEEVPEGPSVITDIPEGCQIHEYMRNTSVIYSGWGIGAGFTDGKFKVAFDMTNGDVYIQNPAWYHDGYNTWVKGTYDWMTGIISIPVGQYLSWSDAYQYGVVLGMGSTYVYEGEDENGEVAMYLGSEIDERAEEIQFMIDGENIYLLGTEGDLNAEEYEWANAYGMYTYWSDDLGFTSIEFANRDENGHEVPMGVEFDAVPAVPANPTADNWYDCGNEDGYSQFGFTLPTTDVDGNLIDYELLSYSIYTDDDQIFTFDANTYYYDLGEDMTEIPYWIYNNGYDFSNYAVYFYRTNEGQNGEEPMFEWRIGIQVHYTVNGVTNSSDIVYLEVFPHTGVNEMNAGKTVENVRYFNVAGQEMAQPSGLTIQVTTYTDGTTSAVKVVK